MQVVDDDDARPGRRAAVGRGSAPPTSVSVARDLGRIGGHVGGLRLPARERRVPGDGRDGPAEAARGRRVGSVVGEQKRRTSAPESTPCSSAMTWANRRAQRYGSPRPYDTFSVHVQANPARAASASTAGEQPGLAHAGFALDDDRRRRGRSRERRSSALDERASSAVAADERARRRRPVRIHASPSRPRRAGRAARPPSTGRAGRPTRAARSRGGRARRGRVASSSRISPGRAIDWIRAAVVIASPVSRRSPSGAGAVAAATTSPVARPIRTSSGSPPPPSSCSPARMARAASAARTASSSCARGQPNTANTASPMNFSRVPPSRSIAAAIVARAAVTRARTSSGSCSASMRT